MRSCQSIETEPNDAPAKAQPAYSRAKELHHELVVDDCHGQQTDWE